MILEPQNDSKFDFGVFFCDFIFEDVFVDRFLVNFNGFSKGRTPNPYRVQRYETHFCDVGTETRKSHFWDGFWSGFGSQKSIKIMKNCVLKRDVFLASIFERF